MAPAHLARASDIVVYTRAKAASRIGKMTPKQKQNKRKDPPISKAEGNQQVNGNSEPKKSVLDMLVGKNKPRRPTDADAQGLRQPRKNIGGKGFYIKEVTQDCACFLKERGPWIVPPQPAAAAAAINAQRQRDGERLLDTEELLNIFVRPSVFVWDPAAIFPELTILCPSCGAPACRSNWCQPRVLHQLHGSSVYITVRYGCYSCGANSQQAQPASRSMKLFLADAPEVRSSFPKRVSSSWSFVDTGRYLCDASVMDLICAMATKSSWSAIAEAMNEMTRAAWRRDVEEQYTHLCQAMHLNALLEQSAFPNELRVTDKCVKNLYMIDFAAREKTLEAEFAGEVGDDILRLDWTRNAAARCGGKHLLNVLDGSGRILMSKLTPTSKPWAAKNLIGDLSRRGVCPKVAYVDDGCCGAWQDVLRIAWPNIHVRLDGMHAIMRLAHTTTSTQHPKHRKFCAMLSKAVYEADNEVLQRLAQAWARDHGGGPLPASIERKYVPRSIRDPQAIVTAVDSILQELQKAADTFAPLLTNASRSAWSNLKVHVLKGCLCDPPGVNMHASANAVIIGGECFHTMRSLRGTSLVEGLHAHQKQWLVTFAQHAPDIGEALLRAKRARTLAMENGNDGV